MPDLGGRFLRGVDKGKGQESSGRDPELADRTAANLGGNDGVIPDPVGSIQSDATRTDATRTDATRRPNRNFETHETGQHRHQTTSGDITYGSKWSGPAFKVGLNPHILKYTVEAGNHSHSIAGGGDLETRPKNAYVYWIIKAWFVDPDPTADLEGAPGSAAAHPISIIVAVPMTSNPPPQAHQP